MIRIGGKVFGGARQADVGKSTNVQIADDNFDVMITSVFGGNDISGTIGSKIDAATDEMPFTPAVNTESKTYVNNTYNAFIQLKAAAKQENTSSTHHIFIGSLFGGGNGEYDYVNAKIKDANGDDTEADNPYYGKAAPTLGKTYLEVTGGTIAYVYGGGNNATVTEATDIYIDNHSEVTTKMPTNAATDDGNLLAKASVLNSMGISALGVNATRGTYHFSRVFGGNNKAAMAIRPRWHLKYGGIDNLYSGGNEGKMTHAGGILLNIPAGSEIWANNVYGGCRKADVDPRNLDGTPVTSVPALKDSEGAYSFPQDFAAHTVLAGGKINNVYGGNDISGNVAFGNAVGIRTSISGDVYGGGNGSYPYTDNAKLKSTLDYGDYYYTVPVGKTSVEALNAFRPNAEQVSIRLASASEANPTIIGGAVYVGGNSATLVGRAGMEKPRAELKIGSYVYADRVFMGNNGENMVKYKTAAELGESVDGVLRTMAKYVNEDGTLTETVVANSKFNSMDLTNSNTFKEYMNGCAMTIMPTVVFDGQEAVDQVKYVSHSSYFGSFYCGGNRGSLIKAGLQQIDFDHEVVIFKQLVGGCNDAYIPAQEGFNAEYIGGVLGAPDGNGDKLLFNLSGLLIEPKRWKNENDKSQLLEWNTVTNGKYVALPSGITLPEGYTYYTSNTGEGRTTATGGETTDGSNYYAYTTGQYEAVPNGTTLTRNKTYYTSVLGSGEFKADGTEVANGSNYFIYQLYNNYTNTDSGSGIGPATEQDMARRFTDGNIYGGCCTSGVVNGNVTINVNATLMDRNSIFDKTSIDDGSLYGTDILSEETYEITERRTGVILGQQGMDVLSTALNLYGGGKGKDTEIWGKTTINMNKGYVFQIYGGSEEGAIGKRDNTTNQYSYDPKYSCYINLNGTHPGVPKTQGANDNMPECEFVYGGGFHGPVAGDTHINLGNCRIFNSFAGACAANILGHTETILGYNGGFPYVRDYVYGGNDLGGKILGSGDFSSEETYLRTSTSGKRYDATDLTKASTYVEYRQGYALGIFGGCYGTYDYGGEFSAYETNEPFLDNAFVNFRPESTDELKSNAYNTIGEVYGSGQGFPGDTDTDKMQNRSYVLIDIPQDMENFQSMKVFGAGAWSGLGINGLADTEGKDVIDPNAAKYKTNGSFDEAKYKVDADKRSAVVDLIRGQIATVFGGSYREGVTRRTVVNVPVGSTIKTGSIFGGAYGIDTYQPCDVYESNVNFKSRDAVLLYNPKKDSVYTGSIYGGNNNERRTIYSRVYISSPVEQIHVIQYDKEIGQYSEGYELTTLGTIYGAGRGANTWSEYTLVDLKNGARVYEAYGGGQKGKVYSAESVQNFISNYVPDRFKDGEGNATPRWNYAWNLGGEYDNYSYTTHVWSTPYWQNTLANLQNPLARKAEIDDRNYDELGNAALIASVKEKVYQKYNANVVIHEGATVDNYAYGGGYGEDAVVSGSTYITLLGGEVKKDIYAAGTSGSVEDLHRAEAYYRQRAEDNPGEIDIHFKVSANVYIQGGTVRNVFGGGWRGSVGHHGKTGIHSNQISDVDNNQYDIDGEAHVIIGKLDGTSHTDGIPSITRNVYGGGEGGAIFGNAYVKINNGYIGYRYNGDLTDNGTTELDERYEEELDDAAPGDNLLKLGGNVFGGGYVANSYTDSTHVEMFGGFVRGSLYGGGEVGPVGRGTVHADTIAKFQTEFSEAKFKQIVKHDKKAAIYKGGSTEIYMWDGHVMRDVFGGGRGYDNWGGEGYMTPAEKLTMDKSSKGFVFGSTDVHIRGGEIGTDANTLQGYGNVFGGGDEGFVYSAIGEKKGTLTSDEALDEGKPKDGGGFYYKNGVINNGLTLDCNVIIEPYCKVKDEGGVTIDGTSFAQGVYVPIGELNKLKNRNDAGAKAVWDKLDTRGITIHNALFAGGNITEGSDKLFANTVTVYGNAGASLRDAYNFDLISLGTEEMGGLYGDGNLTRVDGFRELHIDNYGTDFYSLPNTLLLDAYEQLTKRQQAYYKLKYLTSTTHEFEYYESQSQHDYTDGESTTHYYRKGQKVSEATYDSFSEAEKVNWSKGKKHYVKNDQIDESEYNLMYADEQNKWTKYGVTSIYAGRPMNTIQRADMCGVFGSRLVMKGAVDRAPLIEGGVDYKSYTINRVDEVSLNKRNSLADDTSEKDKVHGNYFGIYNSVKFLGNLTSDVFFTENVETDDTDKTAIRTTDTNNEDLKAKDNKTYYQWKAAKPQWKYRNNGTSHNKVALASGVYLEIKREEGELTGTDDWGYISGVVELDLINVMQGMGGGYVYARNEHGKKTYHSDYDKVLLLPENDDARTYRKFTYTAKTELASLQPIETSGNFVHNTKQIVDDCYPNGGVYRDGYEKSPAHYWYIRGSIYVYDQYISSYTGSASAMAERQEIPLTISAASNGRLTLRDVQPNWYAYYDKNNNKLGDKAANADTVFVVNNNTYKLNQPITYWDYHLLSEGDKAKFVRQTYVVAEDCKIGDTEYKKGHVLLESDYNTLKGNGAGPAVTYKVGDVTRTDGEFVKFFRSSNNLSHTTGYLLTYEVNNPTVWNKYYTLTASPGQANSLTTDQYFAKDAQGNYTHTQSDYTVGPTYKLKADASANVYGQQTYDKGSIIYGQVVTKYNNLSSKPTEGQATVEPAYVVTKEYDVEETDKVVHLKPGTAIYQSKYSAAQWEAITAANAVERAKVCTSLLEFSTSDYVWAGKVLSSADIEELKTKVIAKNNYVDEGEGGKTADEKAADFLSYYLDDAYYCTTTGKYGGTYFEKGKAYRALDTWCSMTADERESFEFNYDAFDLLIDPEYSGNYGDQKEQYDGNNPTKTYSNPQSPIDYTAEFIGDADSPKDGSGKKYMEYTPKGGTLTTRVTASTDEKDWLTREQFENIPNEKHNYSPILVTAPDDDYYMVHTAFMSGEIPYTVGQQIDQETYQSLSETERNNLDKYNFTAKQVGTPKDGKYPTVTYYYCRNDYTIGEKGEGVGITTTAVKRNNTNDTSQTYAVGAPVKKGVVIDKTNYDALVNKQKGFVIHGTSPTEISTLYVPNGSDIKDLSTEKVITVIYLYEYEESDESGQNVTPVSERHILNIHLTFKSGVPEVGDIQKPDIVLPGTVISMNIPTVKEGAYRVTGSGWEIFSDPTDAATHTNGEKFFNNETPLYWYQNNYWVAYYAQTALGKTYSNSVPLSVANYHDLKNVMDDKNHHYYIDHIDVDREPKIYINDYSESSVNGLDLFKNLFNLSYLTEKATTGDLKDHELLNGRVRGGDNLEFFLRTDLDYKDKTWTSLGTTGDAAKCFGGVLHGDGHHISGLSSSLFTNLCGDIYNLGVSGPFTGAGIAETGDGYVENCWIKSTSTETKTTKPVFGSPTIAENSPRPIRIVNSYYDEEDNVVVEKKYTNHSGNYGIPTRKTDRAFYNGEVTYDLNGFYLNKRYYKGTNGTEPTPSAKPELTSGSSYVIGRFSDGDFVYSNGTIPTTADERAVQDENGNAREADGTYVPKWPDDYYFFGQTLNYGYDDVVAHDELPTTVNTQNRVYRAPAYYGNSTMSVAHFNPIAVFAQTKYGDATMLAYKGMTAIDFSGHNDKAWAQGGDSYFYPPLLDDRGLTSFNNVDLTQNLLAYTAAGGGTGPDETPTAAQQTANVVSATLTDKPYSEINETYHTVGEVFDDIRGHWIQQSGSGYVAQLDHFLVDKQDFNAPISYQFATGKRMWYQRKPDNFVDMTTGWEDISLPFTAEIVTTSDKGEITHFYDDGNVGDANVNWKGHEYWLRQYKGIASGDETKLVATFQKPDKGTESKNYTNTFLWDYYYSKQNRQDANHDQYPDATYEYYSVAHTYENYPRLTAAVPYIIGFPSERYYEFDLSGEFKPTTALSIAPAQLVAQVITFASATGTTIGVSDTELSSGKTSATYKNTNYTFEPNYASTAYTDANVNGYLLTADGSSYKIETEGVKVPFRPYFTAATAGNAPQQTRSIVFSQEQTQLKRNDNDHGDPTDGEQGTLNIYAKKHKVLVESSLRETTGVRIVNTAGITIASFDIDPGEIVETRIYNSGVYIVQTTDGKYNKKLAVR